MVTKEQERAALEKIRKIVEGLGEYSYVAAAFEGCFEIAKDNIDNDWACSMKQRAESAEQRAEKLEALSADLRKQLDTTVSEAQKEIAYRDDRLHHLEQKLVSPKDLDDCITIVKDRMYEEQEAMKRSAEKIVEYADDPNGSQFSSVVRNHREHKRLAEYFEALKDRLEQTRKEA